MVALIVVCTDTLSIFALGLTANWFAREHGPSMENDHDSRRELELNNSIIKNPK